MEQVPDNQKESNDVNAVRRVEASKHWQNGHLGVTAEDHLTFGSSPDIELMRNPGKTLGELWSMKKILEKLNGLVAFLEKARREYDGKGQNHPDMHWMRDDIVYAKKELMGTISYLKSIEKLPKKFENFEVKDQESDPEEKR